MQESKKRKVYIIEECDYSVCECIPPNFLSYFDCEEYFDKF